MQSFHRSRGRILFEVFCALAIAESCVGAWMQTGAWAFLPAAVVSALYGVVHAFDMFGPSSAVAVVEAPQPIPSATGLEPTPQQQTVEKSLEETKPEPAAPRASRARRAKSAPKNSRGRTKVREEKVAVSTPPEEPKVAELAPPDETVVTGPAPPPEPQVVKLTPPELVPPAPPPVREETPSIPLTPLFEPAPFVRQQRGAFGRKSG